MPPKVLHRALCCLEVLAGLHNGFADCSTLLQGIAGHGYYSQCTVPIIENTARECELTESLEKAILSYPETSAVLVRRHGVYVWGKDWIHAKTQAECYEYLFSAAVKLRNLGVDVSKPPQQLSQPLENGLSSTALVFTGPLVVH